MRNKVWIIIFALFFSSFTSSVSAQAQNGDIVISTSPQYPSKNENVTVSLSSFVVDMDKSNISWIINGKEQMSGIGKKKFSINTGDYSSGQISIQAKIITSSGNTVLKNVTISPSQVDMLWQASDSYSPPFYRGRTFAASEGRFKVVAMPEFSSSSGNLQPSNLTYIWKKNGQGAMGSSGFGKNFLEFKTSYLDQDTNVTVDASDTYGRTAGQGSVILNARNPKIIFYKMDPELGIDFNNGIESSFDLSGGASLFASPYFFSPRDVRSPDLAFSWSINGESISLPKSKNILSIKPAAGKTGSAQIKLKIENSKTLFQSLEKQINVNL